MKRRALLALAAFAPALAAAQAGARVAVPYYRAADFVAGAHRTWYTQRARDFADEAGQLQSALQAACTGDAPQQRALAEIRRRWHRTALAWDRLSGVAVGPLLSRRSGRQIDFWPVRPASIERAIEAAPADLAALERIGTPAKGLGGLEWMLWSRRARLGQGGCAYAALVAAELLQEAQALAAAFDALAARDWRDAPQDAEAAMNEMVNQWVGGLESLRWQRMERPRRAAREEGGAAYPRQAGGAARASWAARWEALAALGLTDRARPVPAPGEGLVALELYLRGRGLNPLADRLRERMRDAAAALRRADPDAPTRVAQAARAVGRARQLAEAEVAPALDVQIGFSDSDGD